MAKSKKTGPAAKDSKAIADVAKPGTSAPTDTSRAIITHRPMIKDPMVVHDGAEADESEEKPEKQPLMGGGKAEIKLAPIVEADNKPESEKDEEPAAEESVAESKDEPDNEKAAAPETDGKDAVATEDKAEEKPVEPESDDAVDKAEPEDKESKASEPDKAEANETDEAAETDEAKAADSDKKSGPDEEAEAAKRAEEDAKIRKLVDSKKYFLPINAVEHRRSARVAAVGIVLALVLAVAWVDVALDAGLIHLGGIKPVTHLFSN